MKTIIFTITIIFFSIKSLLPQPFILNIHPDRDTLDYFQVSDSARFYSITADYLQRIDLTTNETVVIFKDGKEIDDVFYLIKDSLALIAQGGTWFIYDIYNNSIVESFPAPYDCMIDVVLINNSIYGFSCDDTEHGDYKTKIFLMDLQNNSLLFLCKIPFYGFDLGVNSPTNGVIHFQIEDTNYVPIRYDLSKLVSFSTATNQIVNQTNLSTFGHQGANGYILYKGKNGVGTILSYNNSDSVESYFRIYNFNNNTASNFIYHRGHAEPTITIDNNYLILSENTVSAGVIYNTGTLFIYDINSTNLVKTISLPPWGNLYTFDNFPNNIYYVKDIELPTRQIYTLKMDSILNVLDLTSLNPSSKTVGSSSFTLTVNGHGFDSLSTVYFNDTSKTTTFVSDSVLSAEIPPSDVSFAGSFPVWVTDRYSISDTLLFTVHQATNPNLLVKLTNSAGTQIPASNVKYYDTSWKDAADNGNGTFTVITTKPTVSVRMFYEGANQTVNNVPAQNNTYTFQTVNAAVELRNSSGNLIDEGTVQYYAGAWRSFGTTVNGVANKELLPINYSFRMTYEYGSIDKQQDISVDPTVVFQTVNAAVELRNSTGALIDQGTVQYYAGAWRTFGSTINGVANKELLPKNYSFRMNYEYVPVDKQQDLSANSTVTFSTVLCTVKVTNANNQPLAGANTKYYSGAWRDIGLTNTNGEITIELLPKNLSFRATYGGVTQDKQQDIGVNSLVEIQLNVP